MVAAVEVGAAVKRAPGQRWRRHATNQVRCDRPVRKTQDSCCVVLIVICFAGIDWGWFGCLVRQSGQCSAQIECTH